MKHVNPADVLHAAISRLKEVYVWGAKGRKMWTLDGIKDTSAVAGVQVAFDCSGLVTSCILEAGGDDMRFTHNTDLLKAELPPVQNPPATQGIFVVFFPGHVGIAYTLGDKWFIVEAAGGDHTTTKPTPGAYVRASKFNITKRPPTAWRELP